MLYNIYFDIASLVLTTMLIVLITLRRSYPTKTCTVYKIMLWLHLFCTVFDVLSAYGISYPEKVPLAVNYVFSTAYMLTHTLTASMLMLYVLFLLRKEHEGRAEFIIWLSVTCADVTLVLTSPFTGFVFGFDEQMNYVHGYGLYVVYAIAAFFMAYALVLFVRSRNVISTYQMTTNVVFLLLMAASVFVQYLFPTYLIESFCASVAIMMMNVGLDNPANFFYKNTYCFNEAAFFETIDKKIFRREPFTVLAFTFDDYEIFRKKYFDTARDAWTQYVIRNAHEIFGQKNVYYLSDGCFAVMMQSDDVLPTTAAVTKALGEGIEIEDTKLILAPHYCMYRSTGSIGNASEVTESIRYMLSDVYKSNGHKLIFNDAGLLHAKQRKTEILRILHEAILEDGFEVFYQPILERGTGKFSSAEALVRLSPKLLETTGFIGPDEFIPLAEQNGLIEQLGEQVLDKVCAFWQQNGPEQYGVSYIEVNLSMYQLRSHSAVEQIDRICRHYGVAPEHINFEITETASTTAAEKKSINENIEYLCKKGYSFSLDDYGNGYNNATYIAEMPCRIVKIDKGVLWKGMKEHSFFIVLKNLINLIHDSGLGCVVEGVEDDEMIRVLTDLDVDFFQGFYYSKPIGSAEYLNFLEQNKDGVAK